MKLATLAFVGALVLVLAIMAASLLGYDPQSIGELFTRLGAGTPEGTAVQKPVMRPVDPTANVVEPASFHGPTGKPTIKGPTGPPPQE